MIYNLVWIHFEFYYVKSFLYNSYHEIVKHFIMKNCQIKYYTSVQLLLFKFLSYL